MFQRNHNVIGWCAMRSTLETGELLLTDVHFISWSITVIEISKHELWLTCQQKRIKFENLFIQNLHYSKNPKAKSNWTCFDKICYVGSNTTQVPPKARPRRRILLTNSSSASASYSLVCHLLVHFQFW